MTPYEIGILLHYYAIAGEYPHKDAPIWNRTIDGFKEHGLIENNDESATGFARAYRLTEKGKFYVEHGLCRVPLPVQKRVVWTMPPATGAIDG